MRYPGVSHPAVKPISVAEFSDALRALGGFRPSAPPVARPTPRPVSVACSGGVDSMALACLFAQLRVARPNFALDRGTVLGPVHALVVNHNVRQGSEEEARGVCNVVRKHLAHHEGIQPRVLELDWLELLGRAGAPPTTAQLASLPNMEQLARTGRFRALARACTRLGVTRMFLAHHEDDNYETVLLRLAMGYTGAGLRGIAPAANVPECRGLYGCSLSGGGGGDGGGDALLSEMMRRHGPVKSGENRLCRSGDAPNCTAASRRVDSSPHIPIEDGGVDVYRPLLHFPKARLVATCEAAGLPWFEDPSNADVGLTPRNALRYLGANHVLPLALQKHAVLDMAQTLRRRHDAIAAEARRILIRHGAVRCFSPNSGVLLASFPKLCLRSRRKRPSSLAKEWLRLRRLRLDMVAAAMVRHVMGLVSSDADLPPLSALGSCASALRTDTRTSPTPKPFTHSHVLLAPIVRSSAGSSPLGKASGRTGELNWQLSRQPPMMKRSQRPGMIPCTRIHMQAPQDDSSGPGSQQIITSSEAATSSIPISAPPINCDLPWIGSDPDFTLWDNRFWLRVESRTPGTFAIAPPSERHMQRFRASLPLHRRARLDALLRTHAPGKSRLTLPALYVLRDRGGESEAWRLEWASGGDAVLAGDAVAMVALPSLGVGIDGLDRWVRCEVRYKMIDQDLVGGCFI